MSTQNSVFTAPYAHITQLYIMRIQPVNREREREGGGGGGGILFKAENPFKFSGS